MVASLLYDSNTVTFLSQLLSPSQFCTPPAIPYKRALPIATVYPLTPHESVRQDTVSSQSSTSVSVTLSPNSELLYSLDCGASVPESANWLVSIVLQPADFSFCEWIE